MEHLFVNIIGKQKLKAPKVITIVAQNLNFIQDEAILLRAILAIPTVKQLTFDDGRKRYVHFNHLHREVEELLKTTGWNATRYDEHDASSLCDKMADDLFSLANRSLIVIQDISTVELLSRNATDRIKMLTLVDKLKRLRGHFIVVLYQGPAEGKFRRDLEYISNACVEIRTCKAGYHEKVWYESWGDNHKTLMGAPVTTLYNTFKIGQFYYSTDLLCFYDCKSVSKNYNLETGTDVSKGDDEVAPNETDNSSTSVSRLLRDDDDEDHDNEINRNSRGESSAGSSSSSIAKDSTLPYLSAQDPEKSRIFYYPDKNDDIDEDDPDNDLYI